VELWERTARESIRDLIARYNAHGDSGRFEEVMKLFADDAVMELVTTDGTVQRYAGREHIATVLMDGDGLVSAVAAHHHVRHITATHQIDFVDQTHARGRSHFLVLMGHGLAHWGRYVDEYEVRNDGWVITIRRALTDGMIDNSPTR
jgi:hypothetical protein